MKVSTCLNHIHIGRGTKLTQKVTLQFRRLISTFPGQLNNFMELWLNPSAFGCF